jgi:hypothetical protein
VLAEESGADGAAESGDHHEENTQEEQADDEKGSQSSRGRDPVGNVLSCLLGDLVGGVGVHVFESLVKPRAELSASGRREHADGSKDGIEEECDEPSHRSDAEAVGNAEFGLRGDVAVDGDGYAANGKGPKRDENADGNQATEASDDAGDESSASGGLPIDSRNLEHGMALPVATRFRSDRLGGRLEFAGCSWR